MAVQRLGVIDGRLNGVKELAGIDVRHPPWHYGDATDRGSTGTDISNQSYRTGRQVNGVKTIDRSAGVHRHGGIRDAVLRNIEADVVLIGSNSSWSDRGDRARIWGWAAVH